MVHRYYLKCPSCGKIYQLKIQVDRNFYIYDLPISIECIDCNDILEYTYSSKSGLNPKPFSIEAPKDQSVKTTAIGYSATLPITEDVYMKDLDGTESMLFFSMFMNLLRGHFSDVEIKKYDSFIIRVQDNILTYRKALKALYPILKKGNVDAYFRKMATVFDEKVSKKQFGHTDMMEHFFDMVSCCHANLSTSYYTTQIAAPFIAPLSQKIEGLSPDEAIELKNALDTPRKMSEWYKSEALPYISKMMANIEKLMPAMIYSSVGEDNPLNRGKLLIVTISLDDALDFYAEGLETFSHGLHILCGLDNYLSTGDVNSFHNQAAKGIASIDGFSKLSIGLMADKIEDNIPLRRYLNGSMQHKVRNANEHNGIDYDSKTQHIICHYDFKDENKIFELDLIELCHMNYIQLLHIMEITLLARKIVSKASK